MSRMPDIASDGWPRAPVRRAALRLRWAARSVLPWGLFRANRLVIAQLDLDGVPAPGPGPGLRVRWAGPADIERLAWVKRRTTQFRHFFEQGHRCAVGELDGQPASFAWIECGAGHRSAPNGYVFGMAPDECWAFGAVVAPAFRRRGLYAAHWQGLAGLLRAGGIARVFVAIEADDARSMAAHRRAGFRPLYLFGMVRVAGTMRHHVRAVAPALAPARGWGHWVADAASRRTTQAPVAR